jgi:hypothetical protein
LWRRNSERKPSWRHLYIRQKQAVTATPNTSGLTDNSYSMGLSSSRGGQLNMTAVEPALPANKAQAWRDYLPCWDSESTSNTKTLTNSAAGADAAANEHDRRKQPCCPHLGLPLGFGSSGRRSPHYLTGFVFAKTMSLSVPRR